MATTKWLNEWEALLDDQQAARTAAPPERKLQKALAAFQAAAEALGQPLFVPYVGQGPPRDKSCWLKSQWGKTESAEGLARRGAAHYAQLQKATTGLVYCLDLTVQTSYETVSVGLIIPRWTPLMTRRTGYGVLPYFRYVTSGGAATTCWAAAEVPRPKDRVSGTDTAWDPGLRNYIRGLKVTEPQRAALSAVVEAIVHVEPFLIGWLENTPSRHVWSAGDAARETILAAYGFKRELDPFWGPTVNSPTVN